MASTTMSSEVLTTDAPSAPRGHILGREEDFKVALLQKRIPVGAKEESWVSAQEILKRFSRIS